MVLQGEGQRLTIPALTPPRTAKETPMNTHLIDFGILLAIAVGYIAAALGGAIVLTRIARAARDWINRNDR